MSRGSAVLIAALSWVVAPCHAGKIRVEPARCVDFNAFKTYRWLPTRVLKSSGIVEDDPVLGPAIKDAVNRQLAKQGYREVTDGGDLLVSAGVVTTYIPQLEAVIFAGPEMMYGTPIATMGRYNREGTLVVNLIDSRTKKSAWIGMIQESIDNKAGAGQKKLPGAAEKLFRKYPKK